MLEYVELSVLHDPVLTQPSLPKAAYQMWGGASCKSTDKHASRAKPLTFSHRPARTVSNPSENAKATSNLLSSDILRGNTNLSSIRIIPPTSGLHMGVILRAPCRTWLLLMEAPTTALIMRGRSRIQQAIWNLGHMTTKNRRSPWKQTLTI